MSTGTVLVHLVDLATGGDLAGVTMTAEPGGVEVTTNLSGRARFANLPIGLYRFRASPRGLKLVGTAMVPANPVPVATNWTSFAAGTTVDVTLGAARFSPDTFNMRTFHVAGGAAFNQGNCVACHGDRKNELSAVPTITPFHSLGGVVGHSTVTCSLCHTTIDIAQESGAALRKQVAVSLCRGCHVNYPNSF